MFTRLKRSPSYWRRVLALQESGVFHSSTRVRMLRSTGISVGNEALILSSVYFASTLCTIGDGALINHGCFLDSNAWIHIGKKVFIGPGVKLLTGTHEIGTAEQRAGTYGTAGITIGDGCWLGASSVVLPGVTIAPGCIVGAGAVILRDTVPNGLYVGVPAKLMRTLP